jgi:hypothetical protein
MGIDALGIGAIADFGSKIIDKLFPDKNEAEKVKLSLAQLDQTGALEGMKQDFSLAIEQVKVNAVEAANGNLFVSGWRPAVGWVCVFSYAFNYLGLPLANWIVKFYVPDAPAIVALETGELMTLLGGMLGIGGMRSYDKKNRNK